MYSHVCETQRNRMHATDTTAIPDGRQMAVVACDRSIVNQQQLLACSSIYFISSSVFQSEYRIE